MSDPSAPGMIDSHSEPPDGYTSHHAIRAYLALSGLFTLAASLIWAINTVFLLRVGGLSLFESMIVNASFTLAQMAFEIPTGVLADTIGRRVSLMVSMAALAGATVLYALTPSFGWGIAGFLLSSVLLAFGYTCQTGATEAWLVDALNATGWTSPKDRVFAWGQMAMNVGMVGGSLLGGLLGQGDLVWPYFARAALLLVCLWVTVALVRDVGFVPRSLRVSKVNQEAKKIFVSGLRYGWRSPVVRPLLLIEGISGLFLMYGFYSWQPYVLQLLGRDYVWLLGVVQAGSSVAGIFGNVLVGRISRGKGTLDTPRVLMLTTIGNAALIVAIGAVGLLLARPGLLPAAIAIAGWLVWGVLYGISVPMRMSYLNEHIPSSERATVLSLDAFFLDGGGAIGQPALGYISDRSSISLAWILGGALVGATAPLYASSGSAARAACDRKSDIHSASSGS